MHDILPSHIISTLCLHYADSIKHAEKCFDQHQADEDAVTGALGQALATHTPITYTIGLQKYAISISYQKIRGRGPKAPEKKFGSDGIFQLIVKDNAGNVSARKGLPFQSKMNWTGRNKSLLNQIRLMEEFTPGGIVIDFSQNGYKACTAQTALTLNADRKLLEQSNEIITLAQALGQDFLACKIGQLGLYFDPGKAQFIQGQSTTTKELHVISTLVSLSN